MKPDRPLLSPERATFLALSIVLLALAGAIAYLWIQPRDPADVTVTQVGTVRQAGNQVYVTGEVRNSGDETAEAVQVVAEVIEAGEVVAVGEQFVDFLSGGESEQVVFVFAAASSELEPDLRVASYAIP